MALPDQTVVYCAHEYTQANAAFAVTVEPDNAALQQRVQDIEKLRAAGQPTVPTSIGLERATNPFVRADSSELQAVLGLVGANEVEVFAETRRRKDHF
jgi:hydroxyacylglutathione hydrolase